MHHLKIEAPLSKRIAMLLRTVPCLLLILAVTSEDEFTFNGFGDVNLSLDGIASISSDGLLRLTNATRQTKGQAFYPVPFQFRTKSSGRTVSFSTSFVFAIVSEFPDISSRSARKIRVQYPIEITPLQSLTSIAPGEAQLVMFRIKNISNQTIGSGFDHHGLRYARTEFRRTTGSTDAEHFVVSEKMCND